MSDIYHKLLSGSNDLSDKEFDGIILPVDSKQLESKDISKALGHLPKSLAQQADLVAKRLQFKWEAGEFFSFDTTPNQRVVILCIPDPASTFNLLSAARKALDPLFTNKCKNMLLDLRLTKNSEEALADTFLAAMISRAYEFPKYQTKKAKEEKKTRPLLWVLSRDKNNEVLGQVLQKTTSTSLATNLIRELGMKACNDLDNKTYVSLATKLAKEKGLGVEFFSFSKLKKMGAGAFIAVAQGSLHEDAGILKISYQPKKKVSGKHVALVGKGLTYDTGGVNVKVGMHMYGMQIDMSGSAVALATILSAAELKLPVKMTAYLAIADNAISNHAYRPNEIVYSLSGKSIEIIHTDAEGRMVLADTLTLASRDKPDLIIDFATLTGACVRAIGTTYSGAFTNRTELHQAIIQAGIESGERVWPFPTDKDFGECLDSDIADIKQCRLTNGVDHIEAAMFLSQFFDKKIPWVHIDLSAIENEGGLGAVPTKMTGFGARLAAKLIEKLVY